MHAKQILQKKRSLKDLFAKVYITNFTKKQTENSRKTVEHQYISTVPLTRILRNTVFSSPKICLS